MAYAELEEVVGHAIIDRNFWADLLNGSRARASVALQLDARREAGIDEHPGRVVGVVCRAVGGLDRCTACSQRRINGRPKQEL